MILSALTSQPQTKRALGQKLGWPTRDVEAAIQAARLGGAPIVSSGDGYWLGTPAEVQICAKRLRIRAANQFRTARALRRGRQQWTLGL